MNLQKKEKLTIFESALFRTTSTLFVNDDLLLLVDPNWLPGEIGKIQEAIDRIEGDRPLYLLFTHSDYDHIIGWKAFPDATTIASQALIDNPNKEDQLEEIRKFDDANYIQRDYPILYPEINIPVTQNGQQLKIGNTTLTFYLTPGHNPDGIFTIIEPAGIWIAGDYLSNIEFPYIYHSSRMYEDVLKRAEKILEEHDIRQLIPGHGDPTDSRKEILRRIENDRKYIQSLRETVREEDIPGPEHFYQPVLFPGIMGDFHQKNIALMRKEERER
ncbi:MAG: MBL fold metallo-hydrolase [Bacteroidetes bacterium]|nr:MBL fold metallo-hydrolase [Bacteroidota bacterium]